MKVLAETSFLCAIHREQDNSSVADAWLASHNGPIGITTLVRYEFEQGAHFQAWLRRHDRAKGFPAKEAAAMLAKLEENIALGICMVTPVDWTAVHERARQLAAVHTPRKGARGFDLLHVAAALELRAETLLSFDEGLRRVAEGEGLVAAPELRKQ